LARFSRIYLTFSIFIVLLGAGCKAQSSTATSGLPADVVHRIQTEIRSRYSVPSQIDISLSAPKPADFAGYDTIVVTFTGGTQRPQNSGAS
jgi:hypothetical protein